MRVIADKAGNMRLRCYEHFTDAFLYYCVDYKLERGCNSCICYDFYKLEKEASVKSGVSLFLRQEVKIDIM